MNIQFSQSKFYIFILVLLVLFISNKSYGLEKYDGLYESIEENFELSYFTFGGGYDSEDNIKFDDMYFEGLLNVNLNLVNTSLETKPDHIFLTYFPIRLHVRQFSSASSPVKTPSYNPGVRVIYTHSSWITDKDDFHYLSTGFHHYSNGQNGPHNDPVTGLINTETGSFSSDYIELSYYRMDSDAYVYWWKLNYRAFITSLTWEPEQDGQYQTGVFDISGKTKVDWVTDKFPLFFKDSYLRLSLAYKLGRDVVSPGIEASNSDNMQYTIEWVSKPVEWNDLSWYLRWDRGFDNYNINYQNRINRVQIGVSARN